MQDVDFKVFRAAADLPNGRVAALRVPGGGDADAQGDRRLHGSSSRSTAPRASPTSRSTTRPRPTRKACSRRSSSSCTTAVLATILERTGAQTGDLIFFGADTRESRQRCARRAAREGRPPIGRPVRRRWKPLWVVDFPMFEYDEDDEALGGARTIRSPRRRTATRSCSRPIPASALAKAYDVVLNGWEIGGGSVRIHRRRTCRRRCSRALKISAEDQRSASSASCSTRCNTARRRTAASRSASTGSSR